MKRRVRGEGVARSVASCQNPAVVDYITQGFGSSIAAEKFWKKVELANKEGGNLLELVLTALLLDTSTDMGSMIWQEDHSSAELHR